MLTPTRTDDRRPGSRSATDDISWGQFVILRSRFNRHCDPTVATRRSLAIPIGASPWPKHLWWQFLHYFPTISSRFYIVFRKDFPAMVLSIFRQSLPRLWLNVAAILVRDLTVVFPCVSCRACRMVTLAGTGDGFAYLSWRRWGKVVRVKREFEKKFM